MERYELDPKCPELVERPRQMRHRTGEAVEPKDGDGIEGTSPRVGHQPVESRSALLRADPFVNVLAGELPASTLDILAKGQETLWPLIRSTSKPSVEGATYDRLRS
jgi:hypothetical protein